jgi:soluble lytic murein transglycosylase-like protein
VRKPPQDISSALRAASQAYGVPYSTLAAIAFVESRYNPLAKAATAAGLMQLQPRTAEALGVSDRFNARQSAMGAAKFLKGLYQQFGDWTTAIAAYNWGPGNVKANRSPSQWRDRTQTYVANVLFAKSRV